jgi:hypothetical protein
MCVVVVIKTSCKHRNNPILRGVIVPHQYFFLKKNHDFSRFLINFSTIFVVKRTHVVDPKRLTHIHSHRDLKSLSLSTESTYFLVPTPWIYLRVASRVRCPPCVTDSSSCGITSLRSKPEFQNRCKNLWNQIFSSNLTFWPLKEFHLTGVLSWCCCCTRLLLRQQFMNRVYSLFMMCVCSLYPVFIGGFTDEIVWESSTVRLVFHDVVSLTELLVSSSCCTKIPPALTSTLVSTRQNVSSYVYIRQNTSEYVSHLSSYITLTINHTKQGVLDNLKSRWRYTNN